MLSKQIILSHKGFYWIQRSWPNHMQSCNDSMNIISIYLYFIGNMAIAYNDRYFVSTKLWYWDIKNYYMLV